MKDASETVFKVNGTCLKRVKEFKYLGRVLNEIDCDETDICKNIKKAKNNGEGLVGYCQERKQMQKQWAYSTKQ